MGWDAFAMGSRGGTIRDEKIINQFKRAGAKIKKEHGFSDIHVGKGFIALDCSDSAKMLERAVGLSAWSNVGWNPSKMSHDTSWGFIDSVRELELPFYWSARRFFEICKKNNLTIHFTY